MDHVTLKVNEIFYTIQGEGGLTGIPVIFIRLSGCNLSCEFCDTGHSKGIEMTLEEIHKNLLNYPSTVIIWTGGEPCLQLTDKIIQFFRNYHYWQGIETNGTLSIPKGLQYVTVSPKSDNILSGMLEASTGTSPGYIKEIRIPIGLNSILPDISNLPHLDTGYYYLSPIFERDGTLHSLVLKQCLDLVRQGRGWRLSVQIHKLLKF